MEDKKVKAGSIAVGICLFIIAILLVVIVLFFYNSNKEKNKLQEQISELETTIEEKDENAREQGNNLVLSGAYTILNTDFGTYFIFYKDGTIKVQSSEEIEYGTYVTKGEKEVEIVLNSKLIYQNNKRENINKKYKCIINNEEKLYIEDVEFGYGWEVEKDEEYIVSDVIEGEYIEITKELSEDEIFCVTNANKNSNNTYTLKGVLYTKFTLTKSELEEAVKSGSYNYMNINYTVEKNYKEADSNIQYDYAFIENFKGQDEIAYVAVKKDDNTYYIENTTENNIEWKLTNNYRKITVSGNIEVENRYEEVLKVNDYFNNYEDTKALENDSHPSNSYTFEFLNGNCSKIYERVTGY